MKTKRLELRPLNDRELGMLLNRQTEPELIKAYGEMLLGCRSKPDARLWYTAWAATLPDGTEVGDICLDVYKRQVKHRKGLYRLLKLKHTGVRAAVGINDGNFCVDGLVYPDRRPHTGRCV